MRCIPKYVYGTLWERVGKGSFLNMMFWACVNALKTTVLSVDLLRLLVMMHLRRLRSRWTHYEYYYNLVICSCMCEMSSLMMARSLV